MGGKKISNRTHMLPLAPMWNFLRERVLEHRGSRKKQLWFFGRTSTQASASSPRYVISTSSFPTNHVCPSQDLPSPGPIISHPSTRAPWRTLGSSFKSYSSLCGCHVPREEFFLPPEITHFGSTKFISQGATLVLQENVADIGAPFLQDNVAVQESPPHQNKTSRVSTVSSSSWAWHMSDYTKPNSKLL